MWGCTLFALYDCKRIDLRLFYSLIYRQDICGIPEIMPGPGDNLLHNRSLCAAVSEKNEHNTAAGSCLTAPSMSFCHINRNYGDRILSQMQEPRQRHMRRGWMVYIPTASSLGLLNKRKRSCCICRSHFYNDISIAKALQCKTELRGESGLHEQEQRDGNDTLG